MKILLCAAAAPVRPLTGLSLLVHHLARKLAERHEVHIVALGGAPDGASQPGLTLVSLPRNGVGRDGAALVKSIARREPLRARLLAAALAPVVAGEMNSFRPDVVHVLSGRLARLHSIIDGTPSILTAADAWHRNVEARARVSPAWHRPLLAGEVARVRRFERVAWDPFDRVVMVTEEDAALVREIAPTLPLRVITFGVEPVDVSEVPQDRHRLVFHGVLRYPPNVFAADRLARRILPLVRREVPSASLAIVGRDPSPRVMSLSALPGVAVVGEVPDLVPWLAGSRVYACAVSTGTGIKNKLLEALAAGVPVVSTSLGLQGLGAVIDRDVLCADDDEGFARAIVKVLLDDDLATRLGASGRAYVERHHRWSAVAEQYEGLYREVVG